MDKDEIVAMIKAKLHGNLGTSVKYAIPNDKLRNEVMVELSKSGFEVHRDPNYDDLSIWVRFRG